MNTRHPTRRQRQLLNLIAELSRTTPPTVPELTRVTGLTPSVVRDRVQLMVGFGWVERGGYGERGAGRWRVTVSGEAARRGDPAAAVGREVVA